jgi:DNA modification methylase
MPRRTHASDHGPHMRRKRNSIQDTEQPHGGHSTSSCKLAIQYLPTIALRLDPHNTRTHSDKQVQQIASSIQSFGFNVPVLIGQDSHVLAGHGRLLACRLLGIDQVPVIRLEHLSEHQRRAFMIADNRLTEISEWDDRLLAQQLKALSEVELDFHLEVTGFEMAEIDAIIEGAAPVPEGETDPADALPDVGLPVTKQGDLWALGRHRLLCGDALKQENYTRLMQGRRAEAVFADPPYNDQIDGYVSGFGKIRHREFAMASGEMSEAEFTAFLSKTFRNLVRNSESGSLHFVCLDWRHIPELLAAADGVYSEFKHLCVWIKESGGQGSLYRSRHELVFVFKSGSAKHRNNIQLGQYGRYRTNVWEYSRVSSPMRNAEEQLSGLHPTIKPAAMVADAILDCTARGNVVLDPFLGSGTTVIAAERTGRVCYGMELDPVYVDIAIRRWQCFTGQTAVQESTGRTLDEIEEIVREREE